MDRPALPGCHGYPYPCPNCRMKQPIEPETPALIYRHVSAATRSRYPVVAKRRSNYFAKVRVR